MLYAAIFICHVPVSGRRAFDCSATLHIFIVGCAAAATASVSADQCTCNCTTCSGDIFTASAADLMAEHTAKECANNCAADVGITATLFNHLLTFYPAALLRWAYDCTRGCNGRFIHTLVGATTIFVSRLCQWRGSLVPVTCLLAHRTHG